LIERIGARSGSGLYKLIKVLVNWIDIDTMADDKAKKASVKEGGKKGIDLDGVSATGGVMFFNLVSGYHECWMSNIEP
jgi:hypothetical protein